MDLHQQYNAFKPENTLQALELFENQLTLNALEACFSDSEPEELNSNLTHLFSARWERIRNSEFIKTILMRVAALPLKQQAECLFHGSDEPCDDVCIYIAIEITLC